ncbi:T9SS C-terminal target domain-containing protein [Chitinophaga lutea]|uniref:T9SS C-terminal target domain-containing protein n=1 Tax=Chitinophaga lutea TaxID=2488634 RepID=A0A3N4PM77_9BACT|nr:T9SS type A sorting domain-containing protein [Chitinophaga lutea]RPE09803.1 T9SS C-terminal target domain-containing protein [Chitinophaga lutea]
MLKNSTLLLILLLCTFAAPAMSQSKPTSTGQESVVKVVKAYPNPASSKIYFEIQRNNDKVYEIIVFNFLGKKIDHLKNVSGRRELNLENYYSGLYIFQLREVGGSEVIESGKFNVVK